MHACPVQRVPRLACNWSPCPSCSWAPPGSSVRAQHRTTAAGMPLPLTTSSPCRHSKQQLQLLTLSRAADQAVKLLPITTSSCSGEPGVVGVVQAAAVWWGLPCRLLTAPPYNRAARSQSVRAQQHSAAPGMLLPLLLTTSSPCRPAEDTTQLSTLSTWRQTKMEAAGRLRPLKRLSLQPPQDLGAVQHWQQTSTSGT